MQSNQTHDGINIRLISGIRWLDRSCSTHAVQRPNTWRYYKRRLLCGVHLEQGHPECLTSLEKEYLLLNLKWHNYLEALSIANYWSWSILSLCSLVGSNIASRVWIFFAKKKVIEIEGGIPRQLCGDEASPMWYMDPSWSRLPYNLLGDFCQQI